MAKRFQSSSLSAFLSFSALLHFAVFAGFLWADEGDQRSSLPVGIELLYGESLQVETAAKAIVSAPTLPSMDTHQSDEEAIGEAISQKTAQAAGASSETKKFGRWDGNKDQGALLGQAGVRNGREVSLEERYIYELRQLLERKQHYPSLARRLKQTGTVTLKFTLASDGSILKSEVIEKSPYETLNQAALKTLQSIHGLKPFPQQIHKVSWEFVTPIEYVLN